MNRIKHCDVLARRMLDARAFLETDPVFIKYVDSLRQCLVDPLPKSPVDMEWWYHKDHESPVKHIFGNVAQILQKKGKQLPNDLPLKAFMESLILYPVNHIIDLFAGVAAHNCTLSDKWYGKHADYTTYLMKGLIKAQPLLPPISNANTMTTDASLRRITNPGKQSTVIAAGGVFILPHGAMDNYGVIDSASAFVRCGKIPIIPSNQPLILAPTPPTQVLQPPMPSTQVVLPPGQVVLSPTKVVAPIFPPGVGVAQSIGPEIVNPLHPLDDLVTLAELESLRIGLDYHRFKYPNAPHLQILVDSEHLRRGLIGFYSLPESIAYRNYIEVIEMLRRLSYGISHAYREQNMVADRLAYIAGSTLGYNQSWEHNWQVYKISTYKEIEKIVVLNPLFHNMCRFDDELF